MNTIRFWTKCVNGSRTTYLRQNHGYKVKMKQSDMFIDFFDGSEEIGEEIESGLGQPTSLRLPFPTKTLKFSSKCHGTENQPCKFHLDHRN